MRVPDPQKIIEKISEVNHIYTDEITLHFVTEIDCDQCGYDPVRGEGLDINCPKCGGSGKIKVDDPITIDVTVETEDEAELEFLEAGTFLKDQLFITIDRQEYENHNIDIEKVDYFTFQGEDYVLVAYRKQYLQNIFYEIRCKLEKKTDAT